MKKIIKSILKICPFWLNNQIINLWFKLKYPKLIFTKKLYKFSDEKQKFTHLLECVNYIKVAGNNKLLSPVFFEFGCHSGRTFSAVLNSSLFLKIENFKCFAFDSFQGLPSTTITNDGIFKTGTFNTGVNDFKKIVKKKTGKLINDNNIIIGYYENSLTDELQSKMPKVGIVHIDVDLYSSAITVLNFIKPLLQIGTIILFDDWYTFPVGTNMGEARALKEFCDANPNFKFEEWKSYSTFGKSFFVTALP